MADKAISELVAAPSVTPTDLFVLEQNGTAKKLTGQILENWLVSFADGHGGIQSITKLSTSGLADTYRITLADTTTFDFVVTNGRGISSLRKTATSGLVDTYTFTYNDGTTGTFTVTNGEKGDKGDNAYIWVKYASQEPTASSNSFGDLPDDWMGVYFGTASTAPSDWQQYKWYRIKGDKGETGDPATLTSAEITYQAGDSGTIIPSGNWSSSVPIVTPGRYLWTRQVLRFNTGDPITSYSVSRFGIDGTGAVSSVAGVAPDESGNVPLDAASVKALPIGGGFMEGSIDMNGQKLSGLNDPQGSTEAVNKGYVDELVKDAKTENKEYVDKQKMKFGKLVVFGDSIGAGYNNDNYSYVDILRESGAFESVVNYCVPATTIGPYQTIAESSGYDLVAQIERYATDVADADIIFCEYAGNDVSAYLAGNVEMGTAKDASTATTVCGYTKKALEAIYALNPGVRVMWLPVFRGNFKHLKEYFSDSVDRADSYLLFEATALQTAYSYGCSILSIYEGFNAAHFLSDGMHPNTEGHKRIAEKILHNMLPQTDAPQVHRPITLTNTGFDASWGKIFDLMTAGVSVTATYMFNNSIPIIFYPQTYISTSIIFASVVTYDGTTFKMSTITWKSSGEVVSKEIEL